MKVLPRRKAPTDPPLLFAAPADAPDSGLLIPIREAMRGSACNAVCPHCKEPVIARQGNDRTHHFAHAAGKSCIGGVESALHRFAKEVIAKAGGLTLPAYTHEVRGVREALSGGGWFQFDNVQLEVSLEGIRPDLIGMKMQPVGHPRRLLIEVRVTHAVDQIKLTRIKHLGQSAIEIDLSNLERLSDPEILANAILSTAPRAWLYHAKIPEASRRLNR